MKIKYLFVIICLVNITLLAQKNRVRNILLIHHYRGFTSDSSSLSFSISGISRVFIGDTIVWKKSIKGQLGFGDPAADLHTISSDTIPVGATPFDYQWNQAGADTSFMYIPKKAGLYTYFCRPHTSISNGIKSGMNSLFSVVGTSLTGISDIDIEYTSTAILYPNPASKSVNVPLNKYIKYTLEITNPKGEVVLSTKVANTELYELDVSQLGTGMYYLNTKFCGCTTPKTGCTGASRSFKFVKE